MSEASNSPNYAAIFIDYENVFHYLNRRLVTDERTQDVVVELIRSLKEHLKTSRKETVIIQEAYADFENIQVNAMGSLYLIGVETHNVLGTEHKNAADMRLCIDVMETMYTRPEIRTFLFLAGDRDYIPVIQHLQKHARTVLVAAFKDNVSGDLLTIVEDGFIDPRDVLEKMIRSELEVGEDRLRNERKNPDRNQPRLIPTALVGGSATTLLEPAVEVEAPRREVIKHPDPTFNRPTRLTEKNVIEALEVLLINYGDKNEVWFSPFLNKLRQAMQHLADYERKAIISTMEDFGVLSVEKRRGDPHDYSVIVINWDHPDVRENNPGHG